MVTHGPNSKGGSSALPWGPWPLLVLSGIGVLRLLELAAPLILTRQHTQQSAPGAADAKHGVDPCRDVPVDESRAQPRAPQEPEELVLVTGGSGFIGSHLVEALLRLGYRVRVLDNLETGNLLYLDFRDPRLELLVGDIMDRTALRRAMVGVRGVFHLGAASKVLPSLKDPAMGTFNIERNALGTSRVLEVANETGLVRKVVYSASSTYYGNQGVPFLETAPFQPTSPYAASKYMGELAMSTSDVTYGLPTLSLRLFMVYGPRNPAHGAYAVVTGKFLRWWREGRPLQIEGSGENFRDFVHVKDVTRALILGYQSDVHATSINIGSGIAHSVKEVADLISSDQVHVSERKNDLLGTLADTCRARRLLHFRTEFNFVQTMREMVVAAEADEMEYLAPMWTDAAILTATERAVPGWRRDLPLQDRNDLLLKAMQHDPLLLQQLAIGQGRHGRRCESEGSACIAPEAHGHDVTET